jgi:hypothetical protein
MRAEPVERLKEKLIARLHELGPVGATKTRLGIKNPKGHAAQALQELLRDGCAANIGSAARPCFVLSEHFNPLERACERIERNIGSQKPARNDTLDLWVRRELEKGCQGEVRNKIDEALDWLVKEKRLLRLRRGRSFYWVSAERLKTLLAPERLPPDHAADEPVRPSPSPAAVLVDPRLVQAAYQRLRSRLGYRNVEISELQRELGIPMDALKRHLLEESREGRAVLSLGDWSVSSDAIRAGAIELFGQPHLLVRFDAE